MWLKLTHLAAAAALVLMPASASAAVKAGHSGHSVSAKSYGTKSVGIKSHPTNFRTKNYTKHSGPKNYTKQIGPKIYTKHIGKKSGHHHYSHRRHFYKGIWWSYGVGTCWAYDDYWKEWYWTCGDY